MKISFLNSTSILTVILGFAGCLSADDGGGSAPQRYKFYDAGTLGGPNDSVLAPDQNLITFRLLNEAGTVVGGCDTAAAYAFNADGHAIQGCEWSNGRLHALETASGGLNSFAAAVSNGGLIVGRTSTPNLGANGRQISQAAVWRNGLVSVLGGISPQRSQALAVNDDGLIAGFAFNETPSQIVSGFEYHPVIWNRGRVQDLGTFSGGLGEATHVNDRGTVAGYSIYNTPTPLGVHVTHPFIWKDGVMTDIGFGDYGLPAWMNQRGDVLMTNYLPGDNFYQAFIYRDHNYTNLKPLGGNFSIGSFLTDDGVAVGAASVPGDALAIGALWKDGHVTNLGTVSGDTGSWAFSINRAGVVAGGSGDIPIDGAVTFHHAFVWRNGVIRDLNTLIPVGSSLTLNVAYSINDAGEIMGYGTDTQGNRHIFVLRPLDQGEQEEHQAGPDKPHTSMRGAPLLLRRSIESH